MTTCQWCPENDEGDLLLDQPCGRPARWLSCTPVRSNPVCDDHRCRCLVPLLVVRDEGAGKIVSGTDPDGQVRVVAYVTSTEALMGVLRLWR